MYKLLLLCEAFDSFQEDELSLIKAPGLAVVAPLAAPLDSTGSPPPSQGLM